jgi:hypothetical protein
VPDLNSYQPPGVYVADTSQDLVTPLNVGTPESLLCIVAPALGYESATEDIGLFSTAGTALTNFGVVQDSSLVVTTLGGTPLIKDTDYSVTVSTDGQGNPVTSIQRLPSDPATASPGGVNNGDRVRVGYHYTDSDYYLPRLFTDYASLSAAYGTSLSNVVGTANPVNSPLSLAAKIAFENGAGSIIAVAVNKGSGTWQAAFAAAYAQLITDYRVSVLVPIFPDDEVGTGGEIGGFLTDVRNHCDQAAANGYGRLAITSAGTQFDDTATPFETVAQGVSNKRVALVYPPRANVYSTNLNRNIEVGGGYLAAAIGGRIVGHEVQQPVTRKTLASIASLAPTFTQKMTAAFKNNLAANGVLVVEADRTGRLVVRHGLTTDPTALTTREISLVRISDVLVSNLQVGMDNTGLIGQPLTDDTLVQVKGALIGLLEQEVSSQTIVTYANVQVRQQPLPNGDPSVIECQFAYKPAVPLNYITISFSLDMSLGVTAISTTDSAPTA